MQEKRDLVTIQEFDVEMWAAVIAGSDSTSGVLRAIFYFIMTHLEKMVKLTKIIDVAFENGTLTHLVRYSQAMKVPYLRAVIQESLRLFPPFVVQIPRYAPAAGLQVSGFHISVGMNAMFTQYDKSVFDEDAYEFQPER
ncbi:hypothetical protein HBI56_211410 [Parastagonospora nodorum]|nr:hypothetical protein HBH56_212960 [Parastagonospora nodorum]KAH3923158.1 hypothetical protein HBH54_214630 [Parastagonospora nodorum]KAH3960962.1 hypothetical protein HBH51_187280 [Parastagonospora nodorum]KAH4018292.1 hypothetical protein HBI09_192490 [Parastagonospora nodorum]KAH4046754.1 hypothetical protein HBH49_180150 [Parastagonospora nodorum]